MSSFLNMAGLAVARMSGGSEFHAAGPACEKVRLLNLVHSRGACVHCTCTKITVESI